jgi:hypothetical protein
MREKRHKKVDSKKGNAQPKPYPKVYKMLSQIAQQDREQAHKANPYLGMDPSPKRRREPCSTHTEAAFQASKRRDQKQKMVKTNKGNNKRCIRIQ